MISHGEESAGVATIKVAGTEAMTASPPAQVTVWCRGIPIVVDLEGCRRALEAWSVDGEQDPMQRLADAVGLRRETVSRFFEGRLKSLAPVLQIVNGLDRPKDDGEPPRSGGVGAGRLPRFSPSGGIGTAQRSVRSPA